MLSRWPRLSQRLGFIICLSLCADEVTMKEMAKKNQQLRAGEILIIVVVLFMWAGQFHLCPSTSYPQGTSPCPVRSPPAHQELRSGVIALFCRQYDIIKDNEPNNSKEKAKSASENSTPEHQGGGLLRSKFPKNKPSVNIIEA
ncbi:hypothetical protein CIB84_009102 [Bambusicola thoracicus]|uniref:Uncharacterized protein n=1 Tax=Bambusicola thoracicus TaxID=9083 RepID=A0A2P4SSR3_BAMTH|nr:hypothetical protein CIB84_009102 [Bambusicola thoracicus]